MTLASYVTIDSKKYRVLTSDYERAVEPPKTVRSGINGNTIVSMGPGNPNVITNAVLIIDYSPSTGYGSVQDLVTSANKTYVSYTDHVTGESSVWGQGTFNITVLSLKVLQLPEAVMPTSGMLVAIQWQVVLS